MIPKEKKHTPILKSKKSGLQRDRMRSVYDVLKKSEAFSAWLRAGNKGNPELFVALVADLSPTDRQALSKLTNLVLDAKDSLVSRVASMEKENRHLRSLLLTDDLTGLYNKRFFSNQLKMEMARSRRTGQPCSLMVIDFDNFKMINDTLGHDAGDRFLIRMSRALRDNLRPTDFACRFGGDEYAAIMPESSLADSIRIAQRIHEAISLDISRKRWKIRQHISTSIGLADYDPSSRQSMDDFFKRADRELYRAKHGGKNRIAYEERAFRRLPETTAVSRDERAAIMELLVVSAPVK